MPRHHRRAPRRLPRALLSWRTGCKALRAERAPRHPDRGPRRRGTVDQRAPFQADAIPLASTPGPFMSPTMALTNGTVVPYHADPPSEFTFRVELTTTVVRTPGNFSVFMNLTTITGLVAYATSDHPMNFSAGPDSFS